MAKSKKVYKWIAGTVAVGVLLLALLVAYSPVLLGTGFIKSRIRQTVEQYTGAQLDYQRIELDFFPRVALRVHQAALSLPGQFDIKIESLSVSPDFRELLFGQIHLYGLLLVAPQLVYELPVSGSQNSKSNIELSSQAILQAVADIVTPLRKFIPELSLSIRRGNVLILSKGKEEYALRGFNANLLFTSDGPQQFNGQLEAELSQSESLWQGRVVSSPVEKLDISIHLEDEKLITSFDNLKLFSSRASVNGDLTISKHGPAFVFRSEGKIPDLGTTQDIVLEVVGKQALLDKIFALVPGGAINQFRFSSRGDSLTSLTELHNLKAEAQLEGLRLDLAQLDVENTKLLPHAELLFTRGDLMFDSETLRLSDTKLEILDATLELSGEILLDKSQITSIMLKAQGKIGKQGAAWVQEAVAVPSEVLIRAPLEVSLFEFNWKPDASVLLTTDLTIQQVTRVEAEILFGDDLVNIRKLIIKDKDSNVELDLQLAKHKISGHFSGHLDRQTVNRIFVADKNVHGWLKGELSVDIPENYQLTKVDGALEGGGFVIPLPDRAPLSIDTFSLTASGNSFIVEESAFTWGEHRFGIKGRLKVASNGYGLDLDVSSNEVVLEKVVQMVRGGQPQKKVAVQAEEWNLPLHGEVRLDVKRLNWEHFSLEPLQAKISLAANSIGLQVDKAAICGISTIGKFVATPQKSVLSLQLLAEDQEITESFSCFTDGQGLLTGRFSLTSQFDAEGPMETLADSLKGDYRLQIGAGEVKKSPMMAKLLEVLNVTEIVKGKLPDLSSQAVGYKSIVISGEMKGRVLEIEKFHMDGDTLDLVGQGELDLKANLVNGSLIAAPLKTVDSVIQRLPVINYLLAGSLISIPISIKGDISDPQVRVMSAKSLGSGLLGLAERVLKLPVKIVEPLVPTDEDEAVPSQ